MGKKVKDKRRAKLKAERKIQKGIEDINVLFRCEGCGFEEEIPRSVVEEYYMDGGDLSVHQDLNIRNVQSKWKQYIINLCMVLSMNGKKKYSKGKKRQRRIFYLNYQPS